jgi:hypothetical protein
MGKDSEALNAYAVAIGLYNTASGEGSYLFGKYSDDGGLDGSYIFNTSLTKNSITPSKAYQMNFKADNGFRFMANSIAVEASVMVIENGGNVGIGTFTPNAKLHVVGDARVTGDIYYGAIGTDVYEKPDFVFHDNYESNLDIEEIELFINKNKHLPWLTSAKDEKKGVNLTRMQFETLEAVENMQLQLIDLNKENQQLKEKIENLEELVNQLIIK